MSEVETKVSDEPSINWEAALDQFVSVQAEETIDLSNEFDGESAALEQFLGRDADLRYFLLARRTTPDEQSISRTFIPTPLNCRISTNDEDSTHQLEIRPQDASGVVHEQTRLSGDQWTTTVTKGSPEVVVLKSLDLAELQQARVELVGPERAKREAEAEAAMLAGAVAATAAVASSEDVDAVEQVEELNDFEEVVEATDGIEVIDDDIEVLDDDVDEIVEEDDIEFLDDVDEVEELDDVEAVTELDDDLFGGEIDVIEEDDELIEVIDEEDDVEVLDDVEAVDVFEEETEEADDEEYEYEYVEEEEDEDEADASPAFDIVDEDAEPEVDDVVPGAFDFLDNE